MKFLLLLLSLFITRVDIIAQNFNLEKLSNLEYEREMSDIWGWTDGIKEYALVATTHYFSIVDVTDPENPVKLHQIDGPNGGPGSYWREMKTYGNYAYGVHHHTNLGGSSHGLVIVDLSGLPGSVSTTFWGNDGTLSSNFTKAHNIFIDEFGYAYLVDHNIGALGTRGAIILDLNADPLNPKVVGQYTGNDVHDCFVRDNIMWTAEGRGENGGFAAIDVSDKNNLVELARQSTFGYAHNIWLSDDSNTAFTTDEDPSKPIASFDVSNLNDIKLLDEHRSGVEVIPHNVFIKDDFAIASYYTEGLVVLDASQPDELVKVGQFDTAPNYTGGGFNGCWGVYPYLPSGNIIATDIEEGLYVFSPSYKKAVHLRGKIVDETTRQEIFNANIEIEYDSESTSLKSNIEGRFKKGFQNAGTYNIEVNYPGYSTYKTSISLDNGDLYDEEIALSMVTDVSNNGFDNGNFQLIENPVKKTLLLRNEINIRAPLELNIYNMSGQLLTSKREKGLSNLISLPVNQLNKGIYVLQVRSENEIIGIRNFVKD